MLTRALTATLVCTFALLGQSVDAQSQPILQVSGEVQQTISLSRDDIMALKRRDYTETRTVTQDGKDAQIVVRYQGVPLKDLLDRAGLKPDRRLIRKAIVLLTAKDGYQASFSWGELYNSSIGDGVILVLRQGNEELLESDGLLSLRSLQDERSGPRHVRWLEHIEVMLPSNNVR